MSRRLYLDGVDVYDTYGVYVMDSGSDGGLCSLITYPQLKPFEQQDWPEEDGIEVDLSAPALDTRELSLSFAFSGMYNGYEEFVAMLSDGAYHVFDFADIGRKYTLRLISQSNCDYAINFGCETLRFADDFPLSGYLYKAPAGIVTECDDYLIDGKPVSAYSLFILQGSLSEIKKTPTVKQNMLCDIPTQSGVIYDSDRVLYQSKDVKLYCLMRAETIQQLWQNYDALLYDLVRPQERILSVKVIGKEFPCYYKSCLVTEFFADGKIWLKFVLTLTLTRDLRLNGFVYLIAEDTDEDIYIVLEDGVTKVII